MLGSNFLKLLPSTIVPMAPCCYRPDFLGLPKFLQQATNMTIKKTSPANIFNANNIGKSSIVNVTKRIIPIYFFLLMIMQPFFLSKKRSRRSGRKTATMIRNKTHVVSSAEYMIFPTGLLVFRLLFRGQIDSYLRRERVVPE